MHGLVVQGVAFIAAAVAPGLQFAGGHGRAAALVEQAVDVGRRAAAFPVRHHAVHFVVGYEGAVHPGGQAAARGQIEHVAVAQQLLGAALIENGARIDLGTDLKSDAAGHVGFNQAGDHVHGGPLRGQNQVDAGGAGLLRDTRDQLFDFLADDHHHVGEFVDDHNDTRQRVEGRRALLLDGGHGQRVRAPQGVGKGRAALLRLGDFAVVAGQIAHPEGGHQLVAALHLGHAPAQAVGGVFHVGNHRGEQMRDAVVNGQLQHLGVDQNQAHFGRRGLVQQAEQHRVHAHGLARAGSAGHQQVRHTGQIGHHRVAGNIVAQGQGQRGLGVIEGARREHLAKVDDLAVFVGNLDTHHAFAGDHLDHAHRDHGQGAREILGQIGDSRHFDAGGGLNLKARDDRAGIHRGHLGADPEIQQLEFQQFGQLLERLGRIAQVGIAGFGVEQRQRRQLAHHRRVEERRLLLALDPLGLRRRRF